MSVTTPSPFSVVARGRMPIPGLLKWPAVGVALTASVAAATWIMVWPHTSSAPAHPTVSWDAGRDLKATPQRTEGSKPDPKVDAEKKELPGSSDNPSPGPSKVRLMQVWGAGGAGLVSSSRGASGQPPRSPNNAGGYYPSSPDAASQPGAPPGSASEYAQMLTPTGSHSVEAGVYRDLSLLLPRSRGSFDCITDSPSDNQLAGDISCTVAENVFSADGTNILIDRLATVSGEITRGLWPGQDRGFFLFNHIESKHVYADFQGPGADQLGQIGVPGIKDDHVWESIKGATMLTAIQTSGNVLQNLASKPGSTSINFSQGQSVANQIAQRDLNGLVPTLWTGQGTKIKVHIRQDIHFHVYGNRFVAGVS